MDNHSSLRRSKIVLGLWPLSGDFGPTKLSNYENVIKFALDNGIRTFDTAPNYGNGFSESALGIILQGEKDINFNTKFGSFPFGKKDFSIEMLKKSFEESLIRLKTSRINTIFLHNPRTEINSFNKVSNFMNDLKNQNLINKTGISLAKGFSYQDISCFESFQMDINILYLKDLNKHFDNKINIFGRSPLASGILSGNLSYNRKFHPSDYRYSWLKGERLDAIMKRINIIKNNFPKFKLKSLSRRFLFDNLKINNIIFGVKNVDQIKDILDDADKEELNLEITSEIIQLEKNNFNLIGDNLGF